jgi:predicted Zn-dependent protease
LMKKFAQRDGMDFPLYLRTHPFAKDRIQACAKYPVVPSAVIPPSLAQQFECVKIKVIAFCEPISQASHAVERAKVPLWAKAYGRAIVAYRMGHFLKAMSHLKDFETSYKRSPFTQELRAQILFESGQMGPALAEINQAMAQRPHAIALALLKAQIVLESPNKAQEIIPLLERLRLMHTDIPELWHWLGIAYGKTNRIGRMKICLAEEAVLEQEWDKASTLVRSGLKLISPSDPYYHQGQDLDTFIKREKP